MIKKLIKIQSELKAPKNQNNTFGKYKYRSCEDILEAVKPLLSREGLLLTLTDTIEQIGNRFYVKATVKLTDGTETVENTAYAREEETKKGMDGPQVTGTSSSYARKYALNGLFCIDDTKDADTDEYKTETVERNKAQENMKRMEEQKYKTLTDLSHKAKGDGITGEDIKNIIVFKYKKHSSKELTFAQCADLLKNYSKYWQEFLNAQSESDSAEDKKLMEGIA
jgi:hypothetical protein